VLSRRADKEIFGNLNFGGPECFSDLIALAFREDIGALHNHHLVLFDIGLCEKTATLNRLIRFSILGEK
jgi:hypothetical protein